VAHSADLPPFQFGAHPHPLVIHQRPSPWGLEASSQQWWFRVERHANRRGCYSQAAHRPEATVFEDCWWLSDGVRVFFLSYEALQLQLKAIIGRPQLELGTRLEWPCITQTPALTLALHIHSISLFPNGYVFSFPAQHA